MNTRIFSNNAKFSERLQFYVHVSESFMFSVIFVSVLFHKISHKYSVVSVKEISNDRSQWIFILLSFRLTQTVFKNSDFKTLYSKS